MVASWAENEELSWARRNCPAEFKSPGKVGEATHKMVTYRTANPAGVSIQRGAAFYNGRPQTLERISREGGVCGAVSKFATGMSQAHGVPACPVAQPGHCAYLWWRRGEWRLGNAVSSWAESTAHAGIQWTWDRRAPYLPLFDACVSAPAADAFLSAELLRWSAKFVAAPSVKAEVLCRALDACPLDFLVWRDIASIASSDLEAAPFLLDAGGPREDEPLTCLFRAAHVSDCAERAANLVDETDSEWWTGNDGATIELHLKEGLTSCHISSLSIKWWGTSRSSDFEVYVSSGSDDEYCLSASYLEGREMGTVNDDPGPNGYNGWTHFPLGWQKETARIKILLKEGSGQFDVWNMGKQFGIRQIKLTGWELSDNKSGSSAPKYFKRRARTALKDYPVVRDDVLKMLKN